MPEVSAVAIPGDLIGAFLVAQEDQSERGMSTNPGDIAKRHHRVTLARLEDKQVKVVLYPHSVTVMGGGVTYIIDIERWRVVERRENY
jgi:hypothetical protein